MAEHLEVSIEEQGKTYRGSYDVVDGRVVVHYYGHEASEMLGDLQAASLAESLLRDLIEREDL